MGLETVGYHDVSGPTRREGRRPAARSPGRSAWIANLPNLISVGRLVLVPVIIALIIDRRWAEAFLFFAIAGISDAVDGFIAKRFDLTSELGAYLDPLADKALLISIFVALAAAGVLPAWLAILVVSRDVMIVGAVLVAKLLERPMAIRPLAISKLNTTVQITFAGCMLAASAFGFPFGLPFAASLWAVAALTLASAGAYLARWLDHMSR